MAHNTLTVDEQSQHWLSHPVQKERARADQTVYGPGETFGVQRAWSDSVYPGVALDRALCLTGDYLADLFGAFSRAPHKYDLAWHIRGAPTSSLSFAVSPFPAPVPNGYNAFAEVRQAQPTAETWSIAFERGERSARLIAAAGATTQPILGLGGVYADSLPNGKGVNSTAPTLIERRDEIASTVFGNVLDFSGGKSAYVKSVTQQGGFDDGFGLLRIEVTEGADLCFASYRPGPHSASGLETDALQALVRTTGGTPYSLYLGGGKFLRVGDAAIRRSEEGLASIERTSNGAYILANPSPGPATVTVNLKALHGLEAFDLDDKGKPGRKAAVGTTDAGETSVRLEAGARVGFFPSGQSKL